MWRLVPCGSGATESINLERNGLTPETAVLYYQPSCWAELLIRQHKAAPWLHFCRVRHKIPPALLLISLEPHTEVNIISLKTGSTHAPQHLELNSIS